MNSRALALVCMLPACKAQETPMFEVPMGFPQPSFPADNPYSEEKAELGRRLFYSKDLSGNQEMSCASCHLQERAFSEPLAVSIGSTGQSHLRNANALINVAYNATFTWANPNLSALEDQILLPLFGDNPIEMGANEQSLKRIQNDANLSDQFAESFPEQENPINWENIVKALATFSRTLISGNSRFDQYVYQEDRSALSELELEGLNLFYSERLECHHCHGGFNFTEASVHEGSAFDAAFFHNTGLYNIDGEGSYPTNNSGIFEFTGNPTDMGRFRPPTLRNVALTAPYFHDGSAQTLEEIVRFYERGGRKIEEGEYAGDGAENPYKSGFVAGFELSDRERQALIAFLESLTDQDFLTDPRFSKP